MGCEPDQWARDWLQKQRDEGKTGLTVEKKGSSHYVKWATTVWDRETKKRRKQSKYLGTLEKNGTLREAEKRRPEITVIDVKDQGRARLLAYASRDIIEPLKSAFPDIYPEILALAFCRCIGKGPISKASRAWNTLDDVLGIRPRTSPKVLGGILEKAGGARVRQDLFYAGLPERKGSMAVDMSVCFSRSEGAFIIKKGYNRFRITSGQFNLALVCDIDTGFPRYMKTAAGNVKEGSVRRMIEEFDFGKGTVAVMDRGYFGKATMDTFVSAGLDFVIAANRNCSAYRTAETSEKAMFRWCGRAVSCGKGMWNGYRAYRFEDLSLRNDELCDRMKARDEKNIEMKDTDKAGNIILISSLDTDPETVYRMYKNRDTVEKCFDTAKNILDADRTYMHDDLGIMGHNFVTFVSLYIWMEIYNALERTDLLRKYSVSDVLDRYASVKTVRTETGEIPFGVGADVIKLDAALGFGLYPKMPN